MGNNINMNEFHGRAVSVMPFKLQNIVPRYGFTFSFRNLFDASIKAIYEYIVFYASYAICIVNSSLTRKIRYSGASDPVMWLWCSLWFTASTL